MTTATFVPGPHTWGIGVGIPGYEEFQASSNYEPAFRDQSYNIDISGFDDSARSPTSAFPVRGGTLQARPVASPPAMGNGHRPSAPTDPLAAMAAHWTLDRVIDLLKSSNFSAEWQETFKQLDLHGAKFLDLGKQSAGKSPSLLYSTINPKICDISKERGIPFEQKTVRDEGRRLRKLVRGVVNGGPTSIQPHMRPRTSTLDREGTTPSTAGSDSPGKQMPLSASPGLQTSSSQPPSKPAVFPRPGDDASALPMARSRSAYSETTLGSIEGNTKRHSPNGSAETSLHSPTTTDSRTASSRTTLDSSPQPTSAKPSSTQGRYYNGSGSSNHHRYTSSDHSLNAALQGLTGLSGDSSRMSYNNMPAPLRPNHEKRRPSLAESHGRNSSVEDAPGKEHRGILDKLKLKHDKDKDKTDTERDNPSPSSPNFMRKVFGQQNSSDTALNRPHTGNPRSNVHGRMHSKSDASKRYVMLTPDHWNYRLVDVSGVEDPETFRAIVRYNLQVPAEVMDLPIFMTSPGQTEHHESLSDPQIEQCLKGGADNLATLKLFVQTQHATSAIASGPRSIPGLAPSPYAPGITNGPSFDYETLRRLNAGPQTARKDSVPIIPQEKEVNLPQKEEDRQRAIDDFQKEVKRKQEEYHDKRRSRLVNGGKGEPIDFDKRRGSADDERRDSLVPLRQAPPAPPGSNTLLKANSLKRPVNAMHRSASDRSDGSQYSRKSWETDGSEESKSRRQNMKSPPGGIVAGALANAGKMTGTIGEPSSTRSQSNSRPSSSRAGASGQGSPRSPGFTMSKGNVPFKIPDYATTPRMSMSPDEAAMVAYKDENEITKEVRRQSLISSTSPQSHHAAIPRQSSRLSRRQTNRKSYGPNLDFKEHHVSFDRPSNVDSGEESDSDSDGGLFAVPIGNQQKKSDADIDNAEGTVSERRNRPSLSLRTRSPRAMKKVSFNGDSKDTDNDETPRGEAPSMMSSTARQNSTEHPDSAQPSSITPESPDETTKDFRRRSFYSDVWAARPAVETVAERLDEFFPNVDLDQPMLDPESSPPTSPNLQKRPVPKKSHESLRSQYPLSSTDDSDNGNDSDDNNQQARHPRHTERPISVANRNMRRSGGIGRTKSIRDVVKSVYIPDYEVPPMPDGPSHTPQPSEHKITPRESLRNSHHPKTRISDLKRDTNMMRRRSTKMFGARIEQIKPQRGSRLLQGLETIPQEPTMPPPQPDTHANTIGSGATIKRQATFKWLKGQLIGKGTFGKVFLGFNTTTAELMAVKQVEVDARRAGSDKDKIKEMVKALDQEIDTMQNLEHENIVAYLGCEREDMKISIFLEYIDGGSIGSCLRKHGKFEEPVVSSLTRQTLQGLSYLHDSGILHRDLKADNILLTSDGICKISDFGISKKTDNIYGNDAQNTMQGSVFWMAPEVVRSQGAGYSAKVDIWSLGCVVLEMFAGRRPWAKDEAIGAIYKLGTLNQAPPIPDDVSQKISPAPLSFMYDCFTIDPRERPTAKTLLGSDFSKGDQNFSFFDSELYQKIKPRD